MNEREIFIAALQKTDAAERRAYLDEACGTDVALRQQVESLLQIHEEAGSFLEPPTQAPLPTTDSPLREGPGTVIGPYKLLQQIGEGGMGTVFMAEQTQPVQRKVALKLIKSGMDSRLVIARFEAERQALALMDHPNIARVLDAGTTENGRPYFVMELVKGVPITRYCDEHHLTPRERLELFVPVCLAVQHAHHKGIIHRDMKPSNVMVCIYDGKPVPKVIDFGVAKATGPKLTDRTLYTEFGAIVGTFEYMSPEQAELDQLDVDTRSDVYSLGVLLYELLTGTTPLERNQMREVAILELLRLVREEEAPRPSVRLSSAEGLPSIAANRGTEPRRLSGLVRGELDWIVMKCLEKDRNRRYETANAFAADVLHYLHGETVLACPPSAAYRMRKFARQNRAAFLTTGTVVLALVMGTAASTWQAIRATRAEGLADARLETEKEARTETEAARIEEAAQRTIAERRQSEAEQQRNEADRQRRQAKEQELLARRRFYASQINLAQGAWEQGEPARVLELLEGQRPKIDQTDLRTFEWYQLWRRCSVDCRLSLHLEHNPAFSCAALSPDGKTFAVQGGNSDIKLWDAATGWERLSLKGLQRAVSSMAFAPDNQTLATGSFSAGELILWDVSTGKAIRTLQSGQPGLHSLAFAADGKTLASGGEDGTVKMWDAANWQEKTTLRGHTAAVLSLSFSPDGKALASASAWGKENGLVNLWDLSTKPDPSPRRLIKANTVAFSPDCKTLAIGHENQAVMLLDVATGKQRAVHNTNSGKILCVAYSPNGKTLAIGSEDRTVKLWEPESGRELSYAHHNAVQWVAFTPDGQTVASASARDGAVKLWNVVATPEPTTLQQKGEVLSVAFSPDGRILAAGGRDSTKLWDVATSRETITLPIGHRHNQGGVAFSHDGKTLAISTSKTVELVAIVNRSEDRAHEIHTSNIGGLPFNPDDKNLVFNGGKGGFCVKNLAFSPNDKSLAMAGYNVTPTVWDLASRQVKAKLEGDSIAFSPDSKLLATGGGIFGQSSSRVTLWDADTFEERITCRGEGASWVFGVQFSPDGKLVAQTTAFGTILLWEVASGTLHASLKGHTSPVNCVAFHPDGKTLASASEDKTIKLWDVVIGQERLTLRGHTGAVCSVAFAPDGNTLASGSTDGTVKLWYAATDPDATAPRAELTATRPMNPRALLRQTGSFQVGSPSLQATPKKALTLNNLAWFLATCPDLRDRDPSRAVQWANLTVKLAPLEANNWKTLGVANYRLGDWQGARAALEKSMELSKGGDAFDWVFQAMTLWRLDQQKDAREWYEKAVAWMDKNAAKNEELIRFRAEAITLLGIGEQKD